MVESNRHDHAVMHKIEETFPLFSISKWMNHFTMNAGFISINLTKLIRCIFGCSILDYHHYCLLKALDEDFVYLCF